jgi:hypothetical protein
MQLHALRHLVEAVRALSRSEKILVLGSSSLLASFPELGDYGGPLTTTYDADFFLEPTGELIAGVLTEAIGANSLFEATNGYHADIVHPDITKSLPPGWEERLVPLEGFDNVACLDPYDLAAVKITVGREKDLTLVRTLLRLGKIEASRLRERFQTMPLGERELFKAGRNLTAVLDAESRVQKEATE